MPNEFEQPEEIVEAALPAQAEEQVESWASKWKAASGRWAKETGVTYLSNPAARKDFKIQFRGGRSGWLFGSYLVILAAASLFQYARIAFGNFGATDAQNQLAQFYDLIMIILGVVVTLIAPALAAGAIVAEKQRRSLDLVFSAPVRPRVYLIGKIIASYRYTWILLALSLPFTAMSVILGGASWADVVSAYLLLSIQGLVFTSIGLLFSALAERTVSALIYTYGAVMAYILLTISIAAAIAPANNFGGGGPKSFIELMNPFTLYDALGSTTLIGGVPVPNLLLAAGACLVIIRLCLATAGAALVPPRPRERMNLRLSAATALAGTIGVTAFLIQHTGAMQNMVGSVSWAWVSGLTFMASLALAAFMPFLSCYGFDSDQRAKPNGMFSLRKTFTGTPAGALPYVLFTVGIGSLASWLGVTLAGGHVPLGAVAAFTAYVAGFWTFFWACGRYASSMLLGLKAARTLQFILFVAFMGLPLPLLLYLSSEPGHPFGSMVWDFSLLAPLFNNPPDPLKFLVWGIVLALSGGLLARWSEGNLKRRLTRKGKGLSDIARATGVLP